MTNQIPVDQSASKSPPKLNAKSGLLTVGLYFVLSIIANIAAGIIFGRSQSDVGRRIDQTIGSGMFGTIFVAVILLYVSIVVYRESRKDIFFEKRPLTVSAWYYLFPLTLLGGALFAFVNVDYSAYTVNVVLLVLLATLAIGVSEEIITRGILLVGLRNSGTSEWSVWLITVAVFTALHMIGLLAGDSPLLLLIQVTNGTIFYIARRVSGTLLVPIGLHMIYDTAFFLLPGKYPVSELLPESVLDIQFGSFLVFLLATILFLIFGRGLLRSDSAKQ